MKTIPDTAAEHYATIHTLAVEAFAQHEITHRTSRSPSKSPNGWPT